jgi:hypothetical protein
MENPNPNRTPGREPATGHDDRTDPRRTREPDQDDRTTRQNPTPNHRPDQAPRTS